jgi:peroxiredoxin
MNVTQKIIVFFLFAFLQVGLSAQTSLPDLQLKDINGKSFSLQEYAKNKTIVFSFWATWCVPCINELDAISEDYDDKKSELNFELIAVSIDDEKTKARVKPMINGKGWDYKILMDTNQAFKRALNISSVPYVIIVKNGKIVYTHSGYTPGGEKELYAKLKSL